MWRWKSYAIRPLRIDFDVASDMLTCLYSPASSRPMTSARAEVPNDGVPAWFQAWAARGRMGIRVALSHRTEYRYERAISLGPQVIQLRPALHCRTPILNYSLEVTPSQHLLNWQLDPHNNRLARLLFLEKTNELVVEVDLVAEFSPINPFDFFLEPGVEEYPFAYAPGLAKDLEPYRSMGPQGPLLEAFAERFVGQKEGTISLLLDLNRKVRDEIRYVTRLEAGG